MKSKTKIILFSILIFLSISLVSYKVLDDEDDFLIAKNLDIFHSVIRDVRMYYVEDADYGNLIKESTEELLKKLDPYTVVYPESMIEDYRFMSTGAYGGIGASILEKDNRLIITNIYTNSPSEIAKLNIGDEIVSIGGKRITKKNIKNLKEQLKGEAGTKIALKIKRYGLDKEFKVQVNRKKIQLSNIEYYGLLKNNIGYIKLKHFRQNAFSEFKNSYKKLSDSVALKGLVIDLRGNPGGLLIEAVKIVNMFVDKGNEVVKMKGKVKKWNRDFFAESEPLNTEIPITVLVNNSSASASEIVSGALQDLDRAVIIGQRTYGKGLVQTTRDLSYNTKLKITTAKYYIPSGRCIQVLDYSHRNPDGSVGKIPDSLISEFKTLHGRKVFDGGGIAPDIVVKKDDYSPLIFNLIKEMMIFNYATKFYNENDKISSAKEFSLNENQYKDFINFVKKSDFTYSYESEDIILELEEIAKIEKRNNKITSKIQELKKSLQPNIDNDFEKYKSDIKAILNQEICMRYYLSKGKIISSFGYDKDVLKAIETISDNSKYKSILVVN